MPVRNILKDFKTDVAIKERKCHASTKHKIAAGERHMAYGEGDRKQNICRDCFLEMIPVAEAHWNDVKRRLGL
jgi:hypothetical protein